MWRYPLPCVDQTDMELVPRILECNPEHYDAVLVDDECPPQ